MASNSASIKHVVVTSPFWSRYQNVVRERVIPTIIETQEQLEHWTALTWEEGHDPKPHAFWDSDTYKCIEAACYALQNKPDKRLLATVEETVNMIRKAQHSDGYIGSFYTVSGIQHRWTNLRDFHELYCIGHLIEAAVAYEDLTGSGRLSEVIYKAIDHIASVFGLGPSLKPGYCGHQEIELALLRFYETTQYRPALDLANYFLTERGRKDSTGETFYDHEARARGTDPYDDQGPDHKAWYHGCRDYAYHQAGVRLAENTKIEGHAVRAVYYYTAATDLVRLSSHAGLDATRIEAALDLVWNDMVDTKMYVTGGLGNMTKNEGFGEPYLLPDLESQGCYAETCAAFGLITWCQRMLRLRLDSQYADVMERTLYNGFLGAMSTDGKGFYYQNVLRTLVSQPKERSAWFGCACCPPNVAKLICSLGSYIYATNDDKSLVAIHLYIGSQFDIPERGVSITIQSDLPWSGRVVIKILGTVNLALRIPDWAYGYICPLPGTLKDGYLHVSVSDERIIELTFPTTPKLVYANPKTDKDEAALVRGPLIYCIENFDNREVNIDRIALLDAPVEDGKVIDIGSVVDVPTVQCECRMLSSTSDSRLYAPVPWHYDNTERRVTAIPYFLRANREGNGAMRVWSKRIHVRE